MSQQNLNTFLIKQIAYAAALAVGVSSTASASAPIRYGHDMSVSYVSEQKTNIEPKQFARATNHARDFYYPDERVPDAAFSPTLAPVEVSSLSQASLPTKAATVQLASNKIPYIAPDVYARYVKVGKPYTVSGVTYTPAEDPFYDRSGTASWYGEQFHGKATANGEVFNMYELSAAHPTLPIPSYVLVTNEENGKELVVRINDRGPFKKNRIIDMSYAAAKELDMIKHGTAKVRVKYLGPAEKAGSKPALQHTSVSPTIVPEPASKPAVKASGGHFVQLGSFSSQDNAKRFKNKASNHSDEADVVFATVKGKELYRVVLGPYLSKSEAQTELSRMSGHGFNGLVIQSP